MFSRMASYAFSGRIVFLRIRSCVFVSVVTIGVLWIGLLSLDAFLRGGFRTAEESAAVVTLLAVNAIASISIPIFVLLDFSESIEGCRWFSHVRFEFAFICTHFVLQTTAALLFTILSKSFRCEDPSGNADLEGECRLINVYISIATWFTPLILLSFIAYFGTICIRAARRFPALWRTAARFCPWDDNTTPESPKVIADTRHVSGLAGLRDLEDGSRSSVSRVSSSLPSSHQSFQSFTPLLNSRNPPSQRISQSAPPRAPPGRSRTMPQLSSLPAVSRVPHSRAVSQLPHSRTVSQLPHPRTVSQLPPSLVPSQLRPYRAMSQPPPPRRVSQPLPTRVKFHNTSSQTHLHIPPTQVPSRPLPLRPATRSNLGSSSLDRYAEEWNRDRRGLTMHPSWLGKR